MLFVDGEANSKGSGARVVLILLKEKILEYFIRFTFPSSNNTAEYEAFFAGMKLAKKLEVTRLVEHSDSQLVVQ